MLRSRSKGFNRGIMSPKRQPSQVKGGIAQFFSLPQSPPLMKEDHQSRKQVPQNATNVAVAMMKNQRIIKRRKSESKVRAVCSAHVKRKTTRLDPFPGDECECWL
jgi:hypothetical protein